MPKSLETETEKYAKVKFFNKINANAGGGAINYDDNFEYISIDKALIDSLYKSNLAKEDSLFVKRVEKSDNYIKLISDNKSYSSERIYLDDVNDFQILGKVLVK